MRVGTLTFSQIAALLIVLSLGFPTPSQAVTFWDESFEGHLTPNWDTSGCTNGAVSPGPLDGCNPRISTDIAHTGTKSLKGDYNSGGTDGLCGRGGCGTFYDRAHPGTTDVWTRFYYYTVGFTYYSVETKHFFHKAHNTIRDFLVSNWNGSREFTLNSESQLPAPPPCRSGDASCNYYANMGHVSMADGRWYCVETHVKENSVGSANGSLEMWIDGVQTTGYYNRQFTDSPVPLFDILRIYVQAGTGLMYYDDFAVGDTRIGCDVGQSPASTDITPPATPEGLRAQ
ncbi:MAG: hypothetical protein AAB433_10755 [Nitrospirota bacterium]